MDGLGPGETGLQIKGQGIGAKAFDVTGNVQLKNANYRTSGLLLKGINARTSLRATQDEVSLPDVRVRLRQGGGVDASAKLINYMAPAPPVEPAAAMRSTKKNAGKTAAKTAPKVGPQQEAAIHARVFGIRPEMVFEVIEVEKYREPGL